MTTTSPRCFGQCSQASGFRQGDGLGRRVQFRWQCQHVLFGDPGFEIGTDIALSDIASIRFYGKAGVEFSNKEWEIEGRFAAAQNLPGNPALHLTEAVDSPLYRVGAGLELNGVTGVGMSVRYNGAFGETVKQNAVSASFKVSF